MIRHSRSNSSSVSSSKCSSQSKVSSALIELLGQERGNYQNENTNANTCSSLRDENTLKFIQSFLNSNQKDMNNSSYLSAHQATSSTNYLSVWESSIASQHVQSVSAQNTNRLNDLQDAQKIKEKQLDFLKSQLQKEQDKNEETIARILEMIEMEEAIKEQLQEQIQEGQGIQRRQGIQEQFIRKEQLINSLKWIKTKVMQISNSSKESRENHNSVYPYNSNNTSQQTDRVLQWIKFEEQEKREIGSILRALADKEEAFYIISNAEEKLNQLKESIQMNEEEVTTIQQRQLSLASEYECMESWLDLAKQSSDKMIEQQINLRQVWFCLVQESHNYKILIIQGQDKIKVLNEQLEEITELKTNVQKIQEQNTNKSNNQPIIWSKNELLEELKAREILKKELTYTGKQALARIEELFSGQLSGKEAVYDVKKIYQENEVDFKNIESQNNQEKLDSYSSKIVEKSQQQIQRWKGVFEALQCVVIAEVKDYFDDVMNLRLKQAENDETLIGSSKQKNVLMESSNLQGNLLTRCQNSLYVRRELNSIMSELLNIENRKIIAESVQNILIARRGEFSRQFDIAVNQTKFDWKEGKIQDQWNQISVKIQNQTNKIQQYTHKLDGIVNQLHVLDTQTLPFFQISAPLEMPEGLQFFDDSPNLNLTALNLTCKIPRSSQENTIKIKKDTDVEVIQNNLKNKDSRYYSEQFKRKNQVDQVFKRLAEIHWSNCITKINLDSLAVQLTQNKNNSQDTSKFIEDKASSIIHLNKLLQRMGQGLAQLYLQKLTEEDMQIANNCSIPLRDIQDHESNFTDSQHNIRDNSAETLEKILGKDESMSDGMSFLFSGETLNPGVKLKILHCELERNERERIQLKKKQEELVQPLNLEIQKYEEMICNLQNQAHQQQLQFQQNPQQQQQVQSPSMGIEKGRNLTLSDINDITNEQQHKLQYSSTAVAGGITHTPSKQEGFPVLQSSLLKMRGSNSLSSKQQTITSSSNNNNNQYFLDYYKSNQQSCIDSNYNNASYAERRSHLNNSSSNYNSGCSIGSQKLTSSKILRQFLESPLAHYDKENLNGNQQQLSQEMQIFKKFQINSGNLLGKSSLYDVLDSKQKHPLFCGYGLRTVKIEGDCFVFVNSKTKQIELSVKRSDTNNVFLHPVTFDIIKAKMQQQSSNSQYTQQPPLPLSQTTKKLLEVQFIPIALELKNKGRIECLVESLVQLKQLYGLFRCFIENNHHNLNTFS